MQLIVERGAAYTRAPPAALRNAANINMIINAMLIFAMWHINVCEDRKNEAAE